MKTIMTVMTGGMLLCMAQPVCAAPASRHHGDATVAASDAETADLNARSLQKARASLPTTPAAQAEASPGHPVQAAGTGQTAPVIRVPETGSTVAGY